MARRDFRVRENAGEKGGVRRNHQADRGKQDECALLTEGTVMWQRVDKKIRVNLQLRVS